jgi:hypothetical protein
MVRKADNKYIVRLVNSVVSSTGIKTSCVLDESKVGFCIDYAVKYANELIDALINAGMQVEPALGLSEELGVGDEN